MGKKGKKKPQETGDQPAPAGPSGPKPGPGPQPGPSGDQQKKGKGKAVPSDQPPSGHQPGPSGDAPQPQHQQQKGKGMKGGPAPQQPPPPFAQQPQAAAPAQPPQQGWGARKGQEAQQHGMQQRGPQHQQQGGPQQQRGQQQQQQGPPQQQQQGPPQQQQWGSQHQQQGPPQQQQRGPRQQQQRGPQQQGGPQQQQRGPPQQQWGSQHQQQGPPQQQQGGPPQQQQRGPAQQQQRGPQQQQGPPQQQWGSQQQQSPPQQQVLPQQQQPISPQQQQKGPQQRGQQQQHRGPPQRGAEKPQQPLASSMQQLQLRSNAGDANLVSTSRKKHGTRGRIIKVESNHLQLNLGKLETAYHYDVTIEPELPRRMMRPVMDAFRRQYFPQRWPAFDGRKNLYTSSPLTDNLNDIFEHEITINEDDGRPKKFQVVIKFANKVDLRPLKDFLNSPATPQEALQVVDIVLRMAPLETCFPVGRSFFVKPTEGILDLGEGMEMYHGFYQSAIRGWKPLLNIDVAHKAFPQNVNCVEALAQLLSTFRQKVSKESLVRLQDYQKKTLEKYVRQLRVCYEIPGHPGSKKVYRCNGLGDPASHATFESNGQRMTVLEYFLRQKNCRLRYPDLPTLWVGSLQRKILLPMEFCQILEGQAVNRKMTENQTSNMIKQAATSTTVRKQKIMRGINQANHNASPYVREFGFSVGNEFQQLDARVLEPPQLQYLNRNVRVQKGVWRSEQFLQPATVNTWTIATICRYAPRVDDLKNLASMIIKTAREVGMILGEPVFPFGNIGGRQSSAECEQYFRSQKGKFDIIFVVVPDSGPQYSFVKKAAEIAVGCLTQCIKSNTVARKINPQTVLNIMLKVNSKLNGVNHTFTKEVKPKALCRPCMIMGADVTHPGPDARNIPSVAAVTASHDPKAFQYNICWRLQNPTVEIIADLEAIVIEHLMFFYKKTKVKPEKIVFFRDGVSEGQFEKVKQDEIRAIRAGCKKLQADGYEPKITFLVVQKRHHTRLFPKNQRDSDDRNFNVPAGTCVDTEIVHPFLQDFYLVSHASIQGVAKPTKYCTLWDDNDMDNDEVEQLSYYLCHMFTRCNRSVSYPAPTYYAHLAAARAKVYIETEDHLDMQRLNEEFKRFQIQTSIQKELPMFFV
ncbi:unnamed protein product [Ceutorhynchus assimilis]|uniref:Argonaute 2 n=1 Tax=Ceutorhynchus assimilis TaxID=467358 RepID=A0A9P0GPM8_9CUCU|nr:unnamed protein product [Ceutorhynchus assimilis]